MHNNRVISRNVSHVGAYLNNSLTIQTIPFFKSNFSGPDSETGIHASAYSFHWGKLSMIDVCETAVFIFKTSLNLNINTPGLEFGETDIDLSLLACEERRTLPIV